MRVRQVDENNDWLFGKGRNNYVVDIRAVAQNIKTRLLEFLGDCFFNLGAGIDWPSLLGAKDQDALNLAISTTILNTEGVTGIRQLFINLNRVTRDITIQYEVQTAYGTTTQVLSLDPTSL